MEKLAAQVLVCCLFSAFLLITSFPETLAGEVDNQSEFSYDNSSKTGPYHWGEIRPDWSDCKTGSMQSPIDMLNERVEIVSYLGRLKRNYQPSNATLKNRGHDIKLGWASGAGFFSINGTQYVLQQCHWHSPSEHTINGKRYDLELHMVHESPAGRNAVIGILYTIGTPDSFLSQLTNQLRAITETTGAEEVVGIVDPRQIKFGSRKYYRYIGSLTTPPCTENVVWSIVSKVRTVSREQVNLLRVAVHDQSNTNARPLQPLNNRLVQLYKPEDPERH